VNVLSHHRQQLFPCKFTHTHTHIYIYIYMCVCVCVCVCRSLWPRGLRSRSTAARLLRLWVRIPPEAWMSVCCECCMLSGRGLCDALITRPEESYRLCCVVVSDLESSRMRRPWPALGLSATRIYVYIYILWRSECIQFLRHTANKCRFLLYYIQSCERFWQTRECFLYSHYQRAWTIQAIKVTFRLKQNNDIFYNIGIL